MTTTLRFLKSAASGTWFLFSAVLSVLWAIEFYKFSAAEFVVGDFFRYGQFAVSLKFFVHWGWLFVVSLIVWALRASNTLHRSHRQRQLDVATAASGALGNAGIATSDDLRRAGLTGTSFGHGIRLGFDKETSEVIRYSG